jgi:hypothetical protein
MADLSKIRKSFTVVKKKQFLFRKCILRRLSTLFFNLRGMKTPPFEGKKPLVKKKNQKPMNDTITVLGSAGSVKDTVSGIADIAGGGSGPARPTLADVHPPPKRPTVPRFETLTPGEGLPDLVQRTLSRHSYCTHLAPSQHHQSSPDASVPVGLLPFPVPPWPPRRPGT